MYLKQKKMVMPKVLLDSEQLQLLPLFNIKMAANRGLMTDLMNMHSYVLLQSELFSSTHYLINF